MNCNALWVFLTTLSPLPLLTQSLLNSLFHNYYGLLGQGETVEEGAAEAQQILIDLQQIEWLRIAVVILLAWLVTFLSRRTLHWLASRLPARFRHYILPLVPTLRLLIIAVALLQLFPLLFNVTPENIITILGALGVAIGFAFKDYVSSLLAGIVSIYERPYRAGDWVNIEGSYGEVKEVGMRALKLITPDDNMVTIPHARIWNSNISNANDGQRNHQCIANFYLHPDHNAQLVRQKLWDVGVTSPYTKLNQPVVVIVQEKPWGTHYKLKAYPIDGRNEFQYISDLTVRGKAALAELEVHFATALPTLNQESIPEG